MIYAINIENAHEYGSVLPQLYRLRYRQFVERQGYGVSVYKDMEHDQYDTLATVHLVWMDESKIVRGCSRLNPTNRPYMLKELWPDMSSEPLPEAADIWEGTRICIDRNLPAHLRDRIKWELVLAYLEFGLENGISKYIGVMPNFIWHRVFVQSGWGGNLLGPERVLGGVKTHASEVIVSHEAHERVQNKTGIHEPVMQNTYKIPLIIKPEDIAAASKIDPPIPAYKAGRDEVLSDCRLVT